MNLVLASSSPRRSDLLRQAGIEFGNIVPAVTEEDYHCLEPETMVSRLALEKALSVSSGLTGGLVLGADTVVLCREKVLGKPVNREEACRMLDILQGKRHDVITGLALVDAATKKARTALSRTRVWMRRLSRAEIERYVDTGEPYGKAGAYAIQGRAALFVDKIEGCFFNVVGLPLGLLHTMLSDAGFGTWLNGKDGDLEKQPHHD